MTLLADWSTIIRAEEQALMAKQITRTKILEEAAKIVHERGFRNTGIQEILHAAGIPRGSFYFYFKSKDELGLALVDHFVGFMRPMMDSHLDMQEVPPVRRLKNFFDHIREYFRARECTGGCPIGNLAQELSDTDREFRAKLKAVLDGMERKIAACLEEAGDRGELAESLDPQELAGFILNSWEGALLRMKADKSIEALLLFNKMVFDVLLSGSPL